MITVKLTGAHRAPETVPPDSCPKHAPPWSQPGVTHVPAARDFLNMLRREDTLFVLSGDGAEGFPIGLLNDLTRGQGVTVCRNAVTATPPADGLLQYHRSLGLGPERLFCPASCSRVPLTQACLADTGLQERLRTEASLNSVFFFFKNADAEILAERLGLKYVGCTPGASVYHALNDKVAFAEAGRRHGFETLPSLSPGTADEVDAAFGELDDIHGQGCVMRPRYGVGGSNLHHAKTLMQARSLWRRMKSGGTVLLTPFVPAAKIVRNIGLHGVVTAEGFAPVVATDQIVRDFRFRGGRCAEDLAGEELAAVRACLPGLSSWLLTEGYVDAPAGVDGLVMRTPQGLKFVLVDPNIRMTSTMRPWSVAATLSEAAGRRFAWQYEWMGLLGGTATMHQLRRRLGSDLLEPDRIDQGGILPSCISRFGCGPLGLLRLETLLLGRDAAHLDHLRRRMFKLGLRVG